MGFSNALQGSAPGEEQLQHQDTLGAELLQKSSAEKDLVSWWPAG